MRLTVPISLICALVAASAALAQAPIIENVDRGLVPSGILYDRVAPLSHIERYTGAADTPPAGAGEWRQIIHELSRASLEKPDWPRIDRVRSETDHLAARGVVALGLLNVRYERLREDAVADGSVRLENGRLDVRRGNPFASHRAFAAAALSGYTYRGAEVKFALERRWYITNDPREPVALTLDAGDGLGERAIGFGDVVTVGYETTGIRTMRITASFADGSELVASTQIDVRALVTPLPNDTIPLAAGIAYNAGFGTGEAFVYLADSHTSITQPAVVVEGFDIDNTLNWDELYALLNDENLVEDLRADGFDVIVLNFTDSSDFIQRNGFVMVELLEQVQSMIDPTSSFTVVGASMGGLVARYALAYMETNAIPHQVNTFIAFDTPHKGANIPLGIQYWLDFFASESVDAAFLLGRLDTPASRQMLVYHHTTPPGATGEADPLRADLLNDMAAVGDFPTASRIVAVANGSGSQADQGFAAGAQIISWNYNILLAVVTGNVWAVPDGGSLRIFQGVNQVFFSGPTLNVTVSGTDPFDNAPGGSRATMAQMDSVAAPVGDIVALHERHCFVPTISALALDTDDLFYDVAGDPDILSHTVFDTVYVPTENQPHIDITPENALWFKSEIKFIGPPASAVGPVATPQAIRMEQNVPNPFNPATTIHFYLPEPMAIHLGVFDVRGRAVATLADGRMPAGEHTVRFDARGVASGIYFYRLSAGAYTLTRQMALLK